MEEIFVVTAPGVKPFTLEELKSLNLYRQVTSSSKGKKPREEPGGVTIYGDLEAICRANLHLRTASRVIVRLGDFRATAFSELRKKAGRLAWEKYIVPGQPLALRVTCRKSRLYHSDAVAERVVGAASDRLGKVSPLSKYKEDENGAAAQLVVVRMLHDYCTISIDTSGESLHRRGYRLATAKAPLRETLAATILLASGWHADTPLLDPFCGSGTIPIEAAMLARGLAPGRNRRFAFMNWPGFDRQTWDRLLGETDAAARSVLHRPVLLGSDRDAGAVKLAQENARRGGRIGPDRFFLSGGFCNRTASRAGLGSDQPALWGAGERPSRFAQSICPVRKCASSQLSGLASSHVKQRASIDRQQRSGFR